MGRNGVPRRPADFIRQVGIAPANIPLAPVPGAFAMGARGLLVGV
jgi:hypothetical protein